MNFMIITSASFRQILWRRTKKRLINFCFLFRITFVKYSSWSSPTLHNFCSVKFPSKNPGHVSCRTAIFPYTARDISPWICHKRGAKITVKQQNCSGFLLGFFLWIMKIQFELKSSVFLSIFWVLLFIFLLFFL